MDRVILADVLQALHDDRTSIKAVFEGICGREVAQEKLALLAGTARLHDIRLVAGMKVEYNDGRHDRQLRFGRWVWSVVSASDVFVQALHSAVEAAAFTDPACIHILTEASDIMKVYRDSGVDTCLTGSSSVQCYASGVTGLAVLFNDDGDVLARTVVNIERRRWIRVYGSKQHAITLRLMLRRMGYSLSRRALDGVLLPTWYLGDDEFAAPYLDGDISTADLVEQNGYHWHVRGGGRYTLRDACGRILVQDEYFAEAEMDDRVPCDQCGELVEETATVYGVTDDAVTTRQLCASCRQRHTSPTLIRRGDTTVAPAFDDSHICVWIPGRNDLVHMLNSPRNRGSLVVLGDGTWADPSLTVLDAIDQIHILKRDAIILDYVEGDAVFTHRRNHRDVVWGEAAEGRLYEAKKRADRARRMIGGLDRVKDAMMRGRSELVTIVSDHEQIGKDNVREYLNEWIPDTSAETGVEYHRRLIEDILIILTSHTGKIHHMTKRSIVNQAVDAVCVREDVLIWEMNKANYEYESLQCDLAPFGGAYVLTEEAAKKSPSWLIGRLAKHAETTLDIYMDACEKGVEY